MISHWPRLTPAALALTAMLAASVASGCGGDDGGSGDKGAAAKGSPASASRLTPAGTTLKVGQPAVVAYQSMSPKAKSRLEVTTTKIEKGSIDDLKDAGLEPSQKSSTPYYVKLTVKNLGSAKGPGDLSGTLPTTNLTGVDERDESQTSVTFIGTFERCDEADTPKSFGKGKSFETCLVFLIPEGGGSLAKVKWSAAREVSWRS